MLQPLNESLEADRAESDSVERTLVAAGFTPVDAEVGAMIAEGLSYREIAEKRRCAIITIKRKVEIVCLRHGRKGEGPRRTMLRIVRRILVSGYERS